MHIGLIWIGLSAGWLELPALKIKLTGGWALDKVHNSITILHFVTQ